MSRPVNIAGHPILGRGDLVDAIASGHPEILSAVAQQLELQYRPPQVRPPKTPKRQPGPGTALKPVPNIDSSGYPDNVEDIALWMVTHYSSRGPLERPPDGPIYLDWTEVPPEPEYQLLAPWSVVGPRLRRGLADQGHGMLLDMNKLVAKLAKREFISEIPRRRKRRWGLRFQIIKDISLRLTPFQHDQDAIIDHFHDVLPPGSIEVAKGTSPFHLWLQTKDDGAVSAAERGYQIPLPGTQVLVLSDLGCLDRSPDAWRVWMRWGRLLNDRGCHLLALVPCGSEQIPAPLRIVYSVQTWQKHRAALILNAQRRAELVYQLLVLASPTWRLEPGLLRDLRQLIPEAADASLEADLWNSDLLSSNHPLAATIDFRKANDELRPKFEQLPEGLRRQALMCIRNWRAHIQKAPEIWHVELLCLSPNSRRLLPARDLIDARACIRALDRQRKSSGVEQDSYEAFVSRTTLCISDAAFSDPEVGSILRKARRELHPRSQGVAAGTDPREIPGQRIRRYQLAVNDREILISAARGDTIQDDGKRVAVGSIQSTNQHFTIDDGVAALESWFWKNGQKPDYVSEFGTDKYGAWFEFRVPTRADAGSATVTQRMRWIPAGEFLMGSPADEADRYGDEGPQHTVTLTKGFWLAEAPCTQELWQAVMGDNSSHFKGDRRPVENVSWEDVQKFEQTLPDRLTGLEIQLPTEAQWEYACRAGTTTRYWFGDECDQSLANFDQNVGQTSEIKSYAVNPFGLFDVHGNAWEWCQDYWRDKYDDGPQVDPPGPKEGSLRVMRGGGWIHRARNVRSAYRDRFEPGLRDYNVGFRCMSQSVAEPSEAAAEPVAEQGPPQTRIGAAEKFLRTRAVKVDSHGSTKIHTLLGSQVAVSTDIEEIWLVRVTKPASATAFGRDAYGVFADFHLPASQMSSELPIRLRQRWIPPGKFGMGSPTNEPGRFDNEVPHEVTISAGFWMFETPCTQDLWLAVMGGENPSRFPDAMRPIEQVSWDDAGEFSERLSKRLPGLNFQLPTEAQWEYACRAGTTTAIYSGLVEIVGDANAPALDTIAWYGGNSGHQFDHERPEDISNYDWLSDKQYDFKSAGTRRVRQKRPNPWGLYDMLGNVWEWCADWHGEYDTSQLVDPTGPENGSIRVIRGGGWFVSAWNVRSAYRFWDDPVVRSSYLGFRCMSLVSSAAEQVSASNDEPRDEAAEKQRTQ